MLWSENQSKYRHSFLDSTTTLSTSVFSVFLCQIQGQYFRILYVEYGNTCCQVSNLGIQNKSDFCLNQKFLNDTLISFEIDYKYVSPSLWNKLFKTVITRKVPIKGQLISKGLFGFFNSPKKRTKNRLNYYDTSGWIVFVIFFGYFETPKRHFKSNWPFELTK